MLYFLKLKVNTWFADYFSLPTFKEIVIILILGATFFGIGWGLIGLCPGPAIASLALVNINSIIFLISMISAFFIVQIIRR